MKILNSFKLVCMGVGFMTILLYVAGSMGIGNFAYGPKVINCTKG